MEFTSAYCRRVATGVRSELMASIYEKALKRKDTSGIINWEKAAGTGPATAAPTPSVSGTATPYAKGSVKPPKSKFETTAKNEPEANAGAQDYIYIWCSHVKDFEDTGKIVNLRSGDCTRIAFLFLVGFLNVLVLHSR
jgi:hypothetical protein